MSNKGKGRGGFEIREVWAENLEEEFAVIQDLVDDYPYLALDTEFPGVVFRQPQKRRGGGPMDSSANYQILKANVDALKLIQVGLTLSDENGHHPPGLCSWQFNLREFDESVDACAPESIELLRKSGIDFRETRHRGVDCAAFAQLLMTSGLVLNDSVRWIAFHGAYDFAYLLKLLTGQSKLPSSEARFFELLRVYFPNVCDVKYLMRFCDAANGVPLYGGLDRLAETLQLDRHGCSHQAGSDSLLTLTVYWTLLRHYFPGCAVQERYGGVVYGLQGVGVVSYGGGVFKPAAGC